MQVLAVEKSPPPQISCFPYFPFRIIVPQIYQLILYLPAELAVPQWLRRDAVSSEVTRSRPDDVIQLYQFI
jgi:hypothetical protein